MSIFAGLSAALEFGSQALLMNYRQDLLSKAQRERDTWLAAREDERMVRRAELEREQFRTMTPDIVERGRQQAQMQSEEQLKALRIQREAGFAETKQEQRQRDLAAKKALEAYRANLRFDVDLKVADTKAQREIFKDMRKSATRMTEKWLTPGDLGDAPTIPLPDGKGDIEITDPQAPAVLENIIAMGFRANPAFTDAHIEAAVNAGIISDIAQTQLRAAQAVSEQTSSAPSSPSIAQRMGAQLRENRITPGQSQLPQWSDAQEQPPPGMPTQQGATSLQQIMAQNPDVADYLSDNSLLMQEMSMALSQGADPQAVVARVRERMRGR